MAALVLGAVVLPESGVSVPVLLVVGAGYLLLAAAYGVWSARAQVSSAPALRSGDERAQLGGDPGR